MERLILASASPRRRDLLARLGVTFEVRPSHIDESVSGTESATDAALRLARAKAEKVVGAQEFALAADTVVVGGGRILGKPADGAQAAEMLTLLAGAEHEVVTGVALAGRGACETALAVTRVWFRPIAAVEIERHATSAEALDAAGGYAVQGGAARYVTRVFGSYTNVVGLPLAETARLLVAAGLATAVGERE